ncbi:hypothetical protein SLEP1_g30161 [Rubroshorea leprosula]|uniref:Uncharacterized protein n=1 Tax=Rubroshorea leprosula TaxID=152421 RepID=A0AAV5K7T2_9ROSI|nr:hypothetical protein SLEP1_g30161 [Rubroshorea leprosula]
MYTNQKENPKKGSLIFSFSIPNPQPFTKSPFQITAVALGSCYSSQIFAQHVLVSLKTLRFVIFEGQVVVEAIQLWFGYTRLKVICWNFKVTTLSQSPFAQIHCFGFSVWVFQFIVQNWASGISGEIVPIFLAYFICQSQNHSLVLLIYKLAVTAFP